MRAPYAGARRVWKTVSTAARDGGWAVLLDGRPIRTPGGAPFAAPARPVAEAAVAEWDAQTDALRPETMPVTRALNTAIDRVAPAQAQVAAEVAAYAQTDLLCHRAAAPQALVARQAQAWDPPLDWARARHGAALICVEGVVGAQQPPEALARLEARVRACDAFALTALADLVGLSGSLVLGLAVREGAMAAEPAWRASRVDEDWQSAQWGVDAEAEAAAERARAAFLSAARLAALLRAAAQEDGASA